MKLRKCFSEGKGSEEGAKARLVPSRCVPSRCVPSAWHVVPRRGVRGDACPPGEGCGFPDKGKVRKTVGFLI